MLTVDTVSQRYGSTEVLDALSLELDAGRIGCLLGSSGCGKTTLLRCIAGFESIASGRIVIDGVEHAADGKHTPPEHRPVGMVFQDFALLPHLSVADNVAFGLHDHPAASRDDEVARMLELVSMQDFAGRMPHELSGGQQQRVALARSLARRPKLLLMDEPFSSLDAGLRRQLGHEVRSVLRALDMTALFVTHDQAEAFALADDIGVLRRGQLLQWDRAYDIYHKPATREIADFVGGGGWLPGTVTADGRVDTEIGPLRGRLPESITAGDAVDILLRPDDVVHLDDAPLQARVTDKEFRGAVFLYELELASGTRLQSLVPSHHNHPVGCDIGIALDTEHMVAFPAA
ncbi:MAG: ABC transporter ATP-binding protein [Pseudomonadota bacterium]